MRWWKTSCVDIFDIAIIYLLSRTEVRIDRRTKVLMKKNARNHAKVLMKKVRAEKKKLSTKKKASFKKNM